MSQDKSINSDSALNTEALFTDATMTCEFHGDEGTLRQAERDVALDWQPGDIVLDLYEVRTVFEGFGEEAQEKPYHQGGFGRVYRVWHRMWDCNMAVKTPREGAFRTAKQKAAFIQECETWVNLGLHPHIAACHYVRELGNVPRIFSEYADAGTLSQWIRSERLYEGGESVALSRILDMAIQFAWGLHHAHNCGVIHQDVKPLNALMWHDGSLKVTDFGLAGARQHAVGLSPKNGSGKKSGALLASKGGMTPAYCSPEQASGEPLSLKTDLWSWAVSLLEMFQGEVTWQSGVLAGGALEIFLKHNGEDERIPPMPETVADFLQQCFQKDVADRPEDLSECAQRLIEIYQEETGEPYPADMPRAVTDTPGAMNNRALSFIDLGKHSEAMELFLETLQSDPRNLAVTYNSGLLRWRSGYCDDSSLTSALNVLRHDHPNSWRVLWALGQVDMERGDHASASKHFEQALLMSGHDEMDAALTELEQVAQPVIEHEEVYVEHTRPIDAVCLSPDARYILSAAGSTILLQDTASGKPRRMFTEHRLTVSSLAFSPNSRFIVSGSKDDTIKVWEIVSGKCALTLRGHTDSVLSIAVSADGHYILSGSEDKTVKLWETKTGKCIRTFSGHTEVVRSVCFSSQGMFALSGAGGYEESTDNTMKLWEVSTGKLLKTFTGHERYISSVAFSQDGLHVVSGSNDGTMRLWEVASGKYIRIFDGREGGVWCVDFCPDGLHLLSGGEGKHIRLWEIATGRCIRTFAGHKREIGAFSCSEDGRYLLSGSWDFTLRFWCLGKCVPAHSYYTHALKVDKALERQRSFESSCEEARKSFDAGDVAAAIQHVTAARKVHGFERNPEAVELCRRIGKKANIRGYRGAWLNRMMADHKDAVLSVAFYPNGKFVVSGSRDSTIRVWKVESGECIKVLEGHTKAVNSLFFSSDGQYLLSGGSDGAIRIWNFHKGESIRAFKGQDASVYAVALSPDSEFAVTGDEDGLVKFWTVETGELRRPFTGHLGPVATVCFSPDMLSVISGSADHYIKFWDTRRGRCYQTLSKHNSRVESISLSPDGKLGLSGGWGRKVILWDVATGQQLREFEGHIGDVYCVAFSPDQRFIASCSGTPVGLKKDNTIRLWEVDTGRCLRTFEGHAGNVTSLCFSPDGRFLLSGSEDTTLLLWEIDWEYEF